MRTIIGRRLKQNKRGVSTVITVALSLVIIVIVVANVVLWSYQMNQLDWERMREDIKITNVTRATNSSWFVTQSEYTINVGSRLSGTYTDTQAVDSGYERFREATATAPSYYPSEYGLLGSTTHASGSLTDLQSNNGVYMTFRSYFSGTATSYNPSGYDLWGSTTLASGTVSNLASNDGSYMTFSSYPSSFSATSETRAMLGYRSNTGTNTLSSPKSRTWNGTAWSSESELSTAGSPVRFVRVAYSSLSTRYYERIIVSLSDDGNLDAYVWTGSSWNVANNIASVGTTANAYRPFDIEYEKTSGRALLVYFTNAANEIGYKIWNGTAWSGESTYDLVPASSVRVYWIRLAQNPTSGSNELALVCIDATNSDAYALIWSGSSWGDKYTLTSSITATTTEDVGVAYEQGNGYAHFAYSTGNDAHVVRRTGTATYTDYTVDLTGTQDPAWLSLKADPASNRLVLLATDKTKKLATADWNPTTWGNFVVHDTGIDTDTERCGDVAWESSGSKVLMAWGSTPGALNYKTWTPGGGWSGENSISMAGYHLWVQLKTNPRSAGPKILGATLDSNFDLDSLKWDGTTLTGTAGAFTTDTTVTTYESFEIEFQKIGDPTEYTTEVEFTGTSNPAIWTEVAWKVDSACSVASATVTLQLYNWNTPGYPSSGDGYISYTSSATPDTDETQSQTITVNPAYFRDGSGNWKVKVKHVKSTSTSFQCKVDWIQVRPGLEQYTSEVEFSGSANTQTWTQLVWSIDSAWTAGSVSVTLQLYNYTLGSYPISGNGYISYTSSGTTNTDETKNQTITQNPTHFRNATGQWKMKVKGVKTIATSFDFKADWIAFKPDTLGNYQLDLNGTFTIDLSTYLLAYIQTVEIRLRCRASDADENWYLKAYNWTALAYSNNGFNTTAGHTPTMGWDIYAVNLTDKWRSYISDSGTIQVKLQDNQADANQTTIDIDFLGVRVVGDWTLFTFRNNSPFSSHIVSIWIIDSTSHRRYDADAVMNSGETFSYLRADIRLPTTQYRVRAVTEKGNIAVYFGG